MRLGRAKVKGIYDSSYQFQIGKGNVVREGQDVVIFATGGMVQESLEALGLLEAENIRPTLVNISTLKPIDSQLIVAEARRNGAVITAEDHNVIGGLGDAVLEVLSDNDIFLPVKRIGVADSFAETGSQKELYAKYGLSASHIADKVRDILKNKN